MSTYVIGNWKMNLDRASARELLDALRERGIVSGAQTQVVICPPYTTLQTLADRGLHGLGLGAQNCHTVSHGAYTGEISAEMLRDAGCTYVIVGHSERRRDQFENDQLIGKKAHHAFQVGLRPIICIGETQAERQSGTTFNVIQRQLDGIIDAAGTHIVASSLIAYEPVWAIGTGLAATAEQAQEVHACIRSLLGTRGITGRVPLLYGGSVTSMNAAELFACDDIDGALVGGASLKADEFAQIVERARETSR